MVRPKKGFPTYYATTGDHKIMLACKLLSALHNYTRNKLPSSPRSATPTRYHPRFSYNMVHCVHIYIATPLLFPPLAILTLRHGLRGSQALVLILHLMIDS